MKDGIQGSTTNGLALWTIRSRREHQDQQGTGDGGSSVLKLKTGTEGLDWNGGVSRVLKIAADKDGPSPGTAFAGGHWKSSSKVFSRLEKKMKKMATWPAMEAKGGATGLNLHPSRPCRRSAVAPRGVSGRRNPRPSNRTPPIPMHRVPRIAVTRPEQGGPASGRHAAGPVSARWDHGQWTDFAYQRNRALRLQPCTPSKVVACSTLQRKRTQMQPRAARGLPLPLPP